MSNSIFYSELCATHITISLLQNALFFVFFMLIFFTVSNFIHHNTVPKNIDFINNFYSKFENVNVKIHETGQKNNTFSPSLCVFQTTSNLYTCNFVIVLKIIHVAQMMEDI